MASVGAFNQTLQEFLDELTQTFPENKGIKKQKIKFEVGIKANARLALDSIMPELAKYADAITKRDETVIPEVKGAFPEINFEELWSSGISDDTKKVIWDYMNTLLMLGTTIMTIPTNMLSEIEKIAQSCVSQMQENDTQPDDVFMKAQQSILQNGMFQNLAGQLQNNPALMQQNNQPKVNPEKVNKVRKGKKK